ncbi:MAG: response regulator transcription factor [Bacteroidetes bacterium]|nr:response regulator transcription factor [Bacteroidota bacterium]
MLMHLVSIKSAVSWLSKNEHPDLILMDIQLADGNSFEIFKSIVPKCPVIFITAYDQFALQAFKFNSIDYLLKPVKKTELEHALTKFKEHVSSSRPKEVADLEKLIDLFKSKHEYQKRIIIRFADKIKALEIKDIAYFYTENKVNYLATFDNKTFPIDQNLDEIEAIVDHAVFFRINRQFIVNINAIKNMVSYSKSRVKLELNPHTDMETIVSTERSPNFKGWLTGSVS